MWSDQTLQSICSMWFHRMAIPQINHIPKSCNMALLKQQYFVNEKRKLTLANMIVLVGAFDQKNLLQPKFNCKPTNLNHNPYIHVFWKMKMLPINQEIQIESNYPPLNVLMLLFWNLIKCSNVFLAVKPCVLMMESVIVSIIEDFAVELDFVIAEYVLILLMRFLIFFTFLKYQVLRIVIPKKLGNAIRNSYRTMRL